MALGLLDRRPEGLTHSTLDAWWRQRGFRGDANDLPVLMVDGFFDVESRGAFQGYQELRDDGAHLVVIGAHDGVPAGTDGGGGKQQAWFDHYLRGVRNGVENAAAGPALDVRRRPRGAGPGQVRPLRRADWPVPGTRWESLRLDALKSGTATSVNDGSLGLEPPPATAKQAYPALPSLPTNTDPPNAAIVGAGGFDILTASVPMLGDMTVAEPLGLSYTTKPLAQDVLAAGPASLEVRLSTTAQQTGIWAVISDVSPDGTPHPVASGRLNSDFPGVDQSKSLKDPGGDIVQPYGTYGTREPATPGQERLYRVELWPIGNSFKAGHRIRLHIVGQSAASLPGVPAINTVDTGGSRLLFPVLPTSDLGTALGHRSAPSAGPRKQRAKHRMKKPRHR